MTITIPMWLMAILAAPLAIGGLLWLEWIAIEWILRATRLHREVSFWIWNQKEFRAWVSERNYQKHI